MAVWASGVWAAGVWATTSWSGCDAAPAPVATETTAYIMTGGMGVRTAGPRLRYEGGKRVADDLVIRFEHGKPVVERREEPTQPPPKPPDSADTVPSVPMRTGPVPTGLSPLPEPVALQEPLKAPELKIPKRPKSGTATLYLSLPDEEVPVQGTVVVGDGDRTVMKLVELLYQMPLASQPKES